MLCKINHSPTLGCFLCSLSVLCVARKKNPFVSCLLLRRLSGAVKPVWSSQQHRRPTALTVEIAFLFAQKHEDTEYAASTAGGIYSVCVPVSPRERDGACVPSYVKKKASVACKAEAKTQVGTLLLLPLLARLRGGSVHQRPHKPPLVQTHASTPVRSDSADTLNVSHFVCMITFPFFFFLAGGKP